MAFELSRNITIGQYIPSASLIHRLDARAKIIAIVLLGAAISSTSNMLTQSVLLLVLLIAVKFARISIRYVLRGLLPSLRVLIFLFALQFFFQGWVEPSGYVFFEWRFIRLTAYSAHVIALGVLRVIEFLVLVSLLTLTTPSTQLMHGIEWLLSPLRHVGVPVYEVALANMIALRFIPTLAEELDRISKAQASRGGEIGSTKLWRPDKAARARVPLVVPLFLAALRRSEDLVLAMEARCFVSGARRTRLVELHWRLRDSLVVGTTVLFCLSIWLWRWPVLYQFQ